MSMQTFDMTQEGVNALKEELEHRKVVLRSEIGERIKVALGYGDLSENSEYDEAKQAQADNEQRIQEIEAILKNARVIEAHEISSNQVTLGSKVTLLDLDFDEELNYTLVSAQEEDIFAGKISSESPVGLAIIGKGRGEEVEVKTPVGMSHYKIVDINK